MKRALAGLLLVAGAGVVYFVSGPRHLSDTASSPPNHPRARHVLLITIDTLRADRVGSYGYAPARTPALDALARRGALFTRAYATAPITLTSHASMMTGRYPPGHGARHNGVAMQADVPVLAEAFKQAGFETGAFVSAFPLDRRFGLARGFDAYDDELPRGMDGRRANERAGASTVDRALAWVRARPSAARLFAWVHLFEPHAPYGTPASTPGRDVAARYDDEIALADAGIARLIGAWPDLSDTLVVATADHGEAFGEHGEIGHSIFVYDTTLRVPLIIAGPGVAAGRRAGEPVTLADLAPTISGSAGFRALDADGIDLRPLVDGSQAGNRALYAESFAPLLDFGWAPLRSLRRDGVKLIAAPRPELYDVNADSDERRNVVGERAGLARELATRIDRISSPERPAGQAQADADAIARLRALGYASGGGTPAGARPDPKDRIEIASRMASVTSGELQGAAAERALREVLRDDTGNPQAHQRLGFVLAERGRCTDAEPHFAAAVASRLPSADPYLGLAMCQARRGATAASLATLQEARRAEPGNPIVDANIGLTALQLDRVHDAIDALTRAVTADPGLHQARFALARALGRAGRREDALREATELLTRLSPAAPQRPEVERLIAALR
ncbi:MAG: sulfatase-like hydrolase/transferase [Vicinamibacterales bacterium]